MVLKLGSHKSNEIFVTLLQHLKNTTTSKIYCSRMIISFLRFPLSALTLLVGW